MKWITYDSSTGKHSEYDDGFPYPPNTYLCLCCGYKTIPRRHWHEICPVCFWEDVDQGDHNLDFRDPWNHMVSLRKARLNFLRFGACRKMMRKHVRNPLPEEQVGAKLYW